MSTRWEDSTSHSLLPFTRGVIPPYRSNLGVLVTAATARPGMWVGPSRGSTFHLPAEVAVAWESSGPVYGGRWLCGGKSIGIRFYDPVRIEAQLGAGLPPEAESIEDLVCWKCRSFADGTVNQPVVYRFYDKADQLLYIGSSKSLPNRLSSHRTSTWWFPVVRRIEHQAFQSLEAARAAEREAIRAERPKMNVQHNRGGVA